MQKAIKVKASIKGGKIEVPASIGATVVRVVGPPIYRGATEVTPSHIEQVLPTKDKLVRDDITVLPAPTEYLSTDHNGTFTPSSGKVGFSQVDVNVVPDLRPLSVSENGQYSPDGFDGYSDVTVDVEPNLETLSVTENGLYLPESGTDGFDRVSVDVPTPVLEPLTIDALSQRGTIMPTGDGFSQVAVEEDWDGTLYPVTDESDALYSQKVFNAHHVQLTAGDVLIIDCYGRNTYFGFRKTTSTAQVSNFPTRAAFNIMPSPEFAHLSFKWEIPEDCIVVLAGDNGSREGTHSGNAGYCFCGDYMRWKIIH